MKNYLPIGTISKVEMRQRSNQIYIKGTNCVLLFEKVIIIDKRSMDPGMKLEEANLIALILVGANNKHQSITTAKRLQKAAKK